MTLHIKNGRLVDPKNNRDGFFDLVIERGRVTQISKKGSKVDNADVIDAKGMIVAPGFIDLHTHLREPGFEYKETIESGTKAAAAGGFTTICCMANTDPVNDQASVTETILKHASERGVVRVLPIGAVTKGLQGKELAAIGELKKAGCVALSDDGLCVENSHLLRVAMDYAKSFDLPIFTHALDPCLAAGGVMNEGALATRLGLRGIPNAAEDTMIARDLYLAELTTCRLHICHVSTAEGVDLVLRAKAKGLRVSCEVTPHHLALNDERIRDYDTDAKMMPPLRSEKDRQALVTALQKGMIDAIATDHAPHAVIDKEVEFDCAACGVIGLETALGIVTQYINKSFDLSKLIACLTMQPAGILGIESGGLAKGNAADVVIFDPRETWVVEPQHFHSKSKNSPFKGMKLTGRVRYTLVEGKIVYGGS